MLQTPQRRLKRRPSSRSWPRRPRPQRRVPRQHSRHHSRRRWSALAMRLPISRPKRSRGHRPRPRQESPLRGSQRTQRGPRHQLSRPPAGSRSRSRAACTPLRPPRLGCAFRPAERPSAQATWPLCSLRRGRRRPWLPGRLVRPSRPRSPGPSCRPVTRLRRSRARPERPRRCRGGAGSASTTTPRPPVSCRAS